MLNSSKNHNSHPKVITTDVLVIGGGIAGAIASYRARQKGLGVTLVDKSVFGRSGMASLASGIFKVYLPGDDIEAWVKNYSDFTTNRNVLRGALLLTTRIFSLLEDWGVVWLKDSGKITRVNITGSDFPAGAMMEGGGPRFMLAVRRGVLESGVEVCNRVMVTDLLTSDGLHPTKGRVTGAMGFNLTTGEKIVFLAGSTVICAGAYKFPYAKPNDPLHGMPINLSGDGIAMAFRSGARLAEMAIGARPIKPIGLLCAPGLELLSGLGYKMVNSKLEDFVSEFRKREKVLSRASISTLVAREWYEGKGPTYMDLRHLTPEQRLLMKTVIPIITSNWEAFGYDSSKDLIPYSADVVASYSTSDTGIQINEKGETSIPGLYAAGNSSDGCNMSKSIELSLSAVTGWWAGENAADFAKVHLPDESFNKQQLSKLEAAMKPLVVKQGLEFSDLHKRVRSILVEKLGYVVNEEKLSGASNSVQEVIDSFDKSRASNLRDLQKLLSLRNFVELLQVCLECLRYRKESRASVFRDDFPEVDNIEWLKRIHVFQSDGQLQFQSREIDFQGNAPKRRKFLHPFFAENTKTVD